MGRSASGGLGLTEEHALRAVYNAHGPELYRFAMRQLNDDGAAQDVVQEVFLRAWRAAERFDPEVASLRVWLFAIARNVIVDEMRRRSVRPASRLGLVDEPSEAGFDERQVNAWLVEEALRRITPEHRVCLIETHLRGRPYAEVAAELGIPVGTLRTRLFYGLRALRVAMEEMGVEL